MLFSMISTNWLLFSGLAVLATGTAGMGSMFITSFIHVVATDIVRQVTQQPTDEEAFQYIKKGIWLLLLFFVVVTLVGCWIIAGALPAAR